MALSMTGYGSGVGEADGVVVAAEIRTVNNRYLDFRCKLPPPLLAAEPRLKALVEAQIERGRVELSLRVEPRSRSLATVVPNLDLARAYAEAYTALGEALGVPCALDAARIAELPEVMQGQATADSIEAGALAAERAVVEALTRLRQMRAAEGQRLVEDLRQRLGVLRALLAQIEGALPALAEATRARLQQRAQQVAQEAGLVDAQVDPARLLTEVALVVERSDVTEEVVRLRSHLEAARELLDRGGAIGRKSDFLCQELLREVNTLGAKAAQVDVTRAVVDMKTEVERIREQIQNVE